MTVAFHFLVFYSFEMYLNIFHISHQGIPKDIKFSNTLHIYFYKTIYVVELFVC